MQIFQMSSVSWFDSHCHLDLINKNTIKEATKAGINNIIIPAVEGNSKQAKIISESFENIYFTTGIHPLYLEKKETTSLWQKMKDNLTNDKNCVGIGETGLDFFSTPIDKQKQQHFLIQHLSLAKQFSCPAIIHLRKGFDDFYSISSDFPELTYIMHMFGGSKEIANQYQNKFKNMYFSFGGPHIRKNSKRPKQVLKAIDINKILIETDSPDLPPEGFDKPNSPLNLPHIGEKIAEILKLETEFFRQLTLNNGRKAFSWKTTWKD